MLDVHCPTDLYLRGQVFQTWFEAFRTFNNIGQRSFAPMEGRSQLVRLLVQLRLSMDETFANAVTQLSDASEILFVSEDSFLGIGTPFYKPPLSAAFIPKGHNAYGKALLDAATTPQTMSHYQIQNGIDNAVREGVENRAALLAGDSILARIDLENCDNICVLVLLSRTSSARSKPNSVW